MIGEIRRNLAGAWALMNGRAAGLQQLDLSIEGFWRSFGAVLLVVPFVAVALYSERTAIIAAGEPLPDLTLSYIGLRLSTLMADWVAFPVIFALIAGPLGVASQYVPLIVARNWAAVIIAVIFAAPHLLHIFGVLPTPVLAFVLLGILAVAIRFAYLMVRTALAVTASIAIPVVLLEVLMSFVIELGMERLVAGPLPGQ